jgi:hypothetical protein
MPSWKSRVKLWKWYLVLPVLVVAVIAMTFVVRDDQSSKAASRQGPTTTKQCSSLGTLIESEPIMKGNTKLGELDIYYNKSIGYNCAVTISSTATWGKKKPMHANIERCGQTKPTNAGCEQKQEVYDTGDYKYQAGPVGVSAKGHCIASLGDICLNGTCYEARTKPYIGHRS